MRLSLASGLLLALGASAFAGAVEKGATMQVKPNSIWFQDQTQLARWQKLRKTGDAAALAAYEKRVLGSRDAWQFINPLDVEILDYEPAQQRVHVEMVSEGRMKGTDWLLDPDAIAQ
jgi:hypothetical protein